MSDHTFPGDLPADEMGDYLRLYLDETDEQLDGLIETFLQLENDPANAQGLNEAFRLIHSIKGSSALLGLDRITTLTHHLETHFERLRSGKQQLDTATINVVLRCIDFLRECNGHLRAGEPLHSAGDLLDQVKSLEHEAGKADTVAPHPAPVTAAPAKPLEPQTKPADPAPSAEPSAATDASPASTRHWRVTVDLKPDLPMSEMKAELVVARLSKLGECVDCQPPRTDIAEAERIETVEIILATAADQAAIETAARADGVAAIRIEPVSANTKANPVSLPITEPPSETNDTEDQPQSGEAAPATTQPEAGQQPTVGRSANLMETVRVDVDRLDVLLNLTGELVVNRARLSRLADDISPAFQKSGLAHHATALTDAVLNLLDQQENGKHEQTPAELQELRDHLDRFKEHLHAWNASRQTFGELATAIDQLTRVSNNLQHGVLETRMVPVGPLFNRFKRSIRDIAQELDKRVHLEIEGEKTELDKRMIDEIGDPLNHLIRNSVDHGIEPAEVRIRHNKPETATVTLSASHRGNNVFITVADDGGGIDTERVKQIAVKRGLLTQETADTLSDTDLVELIFQPGFSTAATVSDISGRGVGMDIVRTKISRLNGTISVDSKAGVGTTFTIRLPLTLTITRCMLFQLAHGNLAVPIENVREIVTIAGHRSIKVNGRTMLDIRGELLPLVSIDDLFNWHTTKTEETGLADGTNVVILHANNRSLGLRVDALLGGQDIVVKPLDENFIHIRGLGGASILGDGSVCLLLDAATCIELSTTGTAGVSTEASGSS